MMSGVNYVIYGWSSARTIPGVSLYCNFTLEENIIAVDNLKKQTKSQTLCTIRLFLPT